MAQKLDQDELVSFRELLISNTIQLDTVSRLLIEKGIITDEEFEALVVNADPDFADVLICGYESAMRSSEIAELRAYQVHLDERRISGGDAVTVDYIDLGIFDTKTGARRTVPVSPRLKEVLKRRLKGLEPEDPVFTDKAGRYYSSRITRKMIFCCKRWT